MINKLTEEVINAINEIIDQRLEFYWPRILLGIGIFTFIIIVILIKLLNRKEEIKYLTKKIDDMQQQINNLYLIGKTKKD